ncbi:MAG: amidase family protein [Candidatus Woesearchaeota archaeon]
MRTLEFIEEIKKGNISVEENTHKFIEDAEKIDKEFAYFNTISKELAIKQAKEIDILIKQKKTRGLLLGIPVSVKDCIVVKDVESCAGSRILKGYVPTFNATSVQRCIENGAVIVGKTSQDEFGFGSFSVNVGKGFRVPKNPFDKERVCGGSSGGSAGITQKTKFNHISLAESTGGSIVAPASFCGVAGLCPTYGLVSRYGLIDYANSLDKIGPIGKSVEDCALMLNVISGYDKKDSTSLNIKKEDYLEYLKDNNKKFKVAIIKEAFGEGTDENVKNIVLDKLAKSCIEYEEISLPITYEYSIADYYILATTEASTNLAKYCGMRYGAAEKLEGNFNEYFSKVRSLNFGEEAKRRIILGTFARMAGFREAYYLKALKVRTKIIEEYKTAFKKYDVLISPTMPILPPKFSDIKKLTPLQNYMIDILTVGPNISGMPHLSLNAGMKNGLPVGILAIADHLQEGKLISFCKDIENKTN